jgi:threonine dehydrogenase-like Zn-dependent dehydrogenase
LTNGKGMDVVFDCASGQAGLEARMDAVGLGGISVNVAEWETPVSPISVHNDVRN